MQRAATLVGENGDYARAFAISREATDRHLVAGDMVAVGRTFVDRGMWLYYLERYREAIVMQERALAELPKSEHRHRFTALQGLGLYHKVLGNLESAQHFSELACVSVLKILPLITPLGARHRIVRAAEQALRALASRGVSGMTEGFVDNLRKLVESVRRERHLWRSLLHAT